MRCYNEQNINAHGYVTKNGSANFFDFKKRLQISCFIAQGKLRTSRNCI